MREFKIVKGDLIKLAKQGEFDVIAHGCNCFNTQKSGIAAQMVKAFGTDKFLMERKSKGNINKLGLIDKIRFDLGDNNYSLTVVNMYTQHRYGRNHADGDVNPLDYEALTLCLRKLNHSFKGKHIGLPKVGAGLAGGDWNRIREIIKSELRDCDVTIVEYTKMSE